MEILKGKRLLIVDDERDVIESLKDVLDMCEIDTATDFRTAKELIHQNEYDVAILDIMGVQGHDLLGLANQKDIPTLMLTAHALSPDDFHRSISGGAKAYIPKEKISEIDVFVADLLNAQQGVETPNKWFLRLKSFFEKQFGKDWLKTYHEVQKELEKRHGPIDDLEWF